MTEFEDWTPVPLLGKKLLLLSDLHIPYYSKPSLLLALEFGSECDHIVLNGDICDFFAVSFWQNNPKKRDFQAETEMTANILAAIRKKFPSAHITFKVGNHEERLERYLEVKAPELLGCKWLSYENLFNMKELDIKLVSDKRIMKIGEKLNVIHGHELGKGIFSPVNPARGLYMRGKECCIAGHNHQTSQHSEKTMDDKVIGCWSTGCLSDMHPKYAVLNKWNHGFALVENNAEKGFTVYNKSIINGKIY
jgi:predicted phosphodiesterase